MSSIIKNLDRREITAMVAHDTHLPEKTVAKVLSEFFVALISGVALKEYAELEGLGSFRVKRIAAESGTDPHGNPYSVGERVTVEFNPFEPFRDEVERITGLPCIA